MWKLGINKCLLNNLGIVSIINIASENNSIFFSIINFNLGVVSRSASKIFQQYTSQLKKTLAILHRIPWQVSVGPDVSMKEKHQHPTPWHNPGI